MVSESATRNLEALLDSGLPSTLFGRPVVIRDSGLPSTLFGRPVVIRDSVVEVEPKPRTLRRREILRNRKAAVSLARMAEEIKSWRGTDMEMFETMFGL